MPNGFSITTCDRSTNSVFFNMVMTDWAPVSGTDR
jgi:hypothetical protein